MTIALAGSQFFSADPAAAKSRVALYLVLTLAPFAILSPFIGPLLDRFQGSQKWIVVCAAAGRAMVCLIMSGHLKGLLFYPLAFTVLVLSKSYSISRSALIPAIVQRDEELVKANSRLSLVTGLIGFAIAAPGAGILKLLGASIVLWFAAAAFLGAAWAGTRITFVRPVGTAPPHEQPSSATYATPTSARERLRGARRRAFDAHARATGVRLAAFAMASVRGLVGFLAFLIAFTLRRADAPTWWYGLVLAAGGVGGLLGAVIAPKLREATSEERMIVGALGLCGVAGLLASFSPTRTASALAAAGVAFAAALSRLAFDALVQRDSDESVRGSVFARFETRFQLMWVVGAILPVVIAIPRRGGFLIMATASAITIAVYLGGEPVLERISERVRKAFEKRPVKVEGDDDDSDLGLRRNPRTD